MTDLVVWRYLLQEIGDEGTAVAVFAAAIDLIDPDDPYVDAFLKAVHSRQEAE